MFDYDKEFLVTAALWLICFVGVCFVGYLVFSMLHSFYASAQALVGAATPA